MLVERKLLPETVHLGVALLDRFLASSPMQLDQARGKLLAIASLHAAAKYEETLEGPDMMDGFSASPQLRSDVRTAEGWLLNGIGWNLTTVTPVMFLRESPCP